MKLKNIILKEFDYLNKFEFKYQSSGKEGVDGVYSLFNNGKHIVSFPKEDWLYIKDLIQKKVK